MKPTIYPFLRYTNAPAAMEWLGRAFLFEKQVAFAGPDGMIVHAEMRRGDSTIMLNLGDTQGSSNGPAQAISVRVDDPDALFAHATAEGAAVVQAPVTTHYGARSCWVRDPDNFLWGFSTYRPAHSGGSWIMSRP